DVEWAHATAPYAKIVLVEAASATYVDLFNAVKVAVNMNVNTVSMSFGGSEFKGQSAYDSIFTTPGVTFIAASGDSGAPAGYPAYSPNVLSVGGTTLVKISGNIYQETGWGNGALSPYYGGGGGGISQFEPMPSYQVNTDAHYISSVVNTLS